MKPITRLARYPLLLEAVLRQTPEDCNDKQEIPKVVTLVREFLAELNVQAGRTENKFNLLRLEQQLLFRPGEQVVRAIHGYPNGVYLYSLLGSEAEGGRS